MPRHVVVDGSNLATEGRSVPSLKQLNEAVLAYMSENPDALITVVVDATFGHRIDAKEVAEFDAAVSNNEIVAPPAGAIGRGDAFVLSIANKVNATILSNDSYQEFHGTHTWLFDEGRLVGGKPVPHIGWVFVNRLPVRGPTSRKSVSEAKRGRAPKVKSASPEASQPMPIPAAPPPGATLHKPGRGRDAKPATAPAAKSSDAPKAADVAKHAGDPRAEPTPRSTGTNDLLAFLTFVEHHKPGSSVNAIVENYSSHGAYVRIGDVKGYVPLSLMSDPPPRSAREFMKIGESITLVVESFGAGAPQHRLGDPDDDHREGASRRGSRGSQAEACHSQVSGQGGCDTRAGRCGGGRDCCSGTDSAQAGDEEGGDCSRRRQAEDTGQEGCSTTAARRTLASGIAAGGRARRAAACQEARPAKGSSCSAATGRIQGDFRAHAGCQAHSAPGQVGIAKPESGRTWSVDGIVRYGRTCADRHLERQLAEGSPREGRTMAGRYPARHLVHAGDQAQ